MSKSSLRERKKQRSRDDILSAAQQLIAERGYVKVRMRDISESADVSYQTLYNYFPTKAHITEALITADIDPLRGQMTATIDGQACEPLRALELLNQLRFDFLEAHDRDIWRDLCIALLQRESRPNQIGQLIEAHTSQPTIELITRSRATGALARVDTNVLARTINDLTNTALNAYLMNPEADASMILARLSSQLTLVLSPYLAEGVASP